MSRRPRFSQFARALALTWAGQIAFAALGLAASVAAARALGPSGRGELAVLIVVPTLLGVALELGQEFTTSHLSARNAALRSALYGNAAVYAALLVVPSFLLTAAAYQELLPRGDRAVPAAALGALAVAAVVFGKAAGGVALGARRVAFYTAARVALSGSYLVGILLVYALGRATAPLIFAAWTASNVVLAVV